MLTLGKSHQIIGEIVKTYTKDEFKNKLTDYRIVDNKYYLIDFNSYVLSYSHDNLVDVFDTKLSYFASRCFYHAFQRLTYTLIENMMCRTPKSNIIRAHNNDVYMTSQDLIRTRSFDKKEAESWNKKENTIIYQSFEKSFKDITGLTPAYYLESLLLNQMSQADVNNFDDMILDGSFLDVIFSPKCCIKIESSYKMI